MNFTVAVLKCGAKVFSDYCGFFLMLESSDYQPQQFAILIISVIWLPNYSTEM